MEQNYRNFWKTIKFVFSQLSKIHGFLRLCIYLTFLCIIISIGVNLLTPVLLKKLIDALSLTQTDNLKDLALPLLIAYGGSWTIGQVMQQLREVVFMKVISRVIFEVSSEIIAALLNLSMRFHTFKQTGSIIAAIKQAQAGIPPILWGFLFTITPIVIEIIFASLLLTFYYGKAYGLIIISLTVIYFLFTIITSDIILKKQASFDLARRDEAGKVADSLLNIETVKYFGKSHQELDACKIALKNREVKEGEFYQSLEVIHLLQGLILGLGFSFTIIFSGLSVLNGIIFVGDFVMINSYLIQFARPFMHLSHFIRDVRKSVLDMQAAFNFINLEESFDENKENMNIDGKEIEIVFSNVGFEYFKEITILKDLNFKIPAKKMTAIVGATGGGKSTITKLLFRFYDVTEGEILINGENLKRYSQQSICDNFSVVPQVVALFNDTLKYNLCYGKPDATEAEIWEAIKIAQLETFVKNLPHGFETKVGENGLRLSGGEKQRLAIARAFLKKPKLFIFDEATSALDTTTEKIIQQSLVDIASGITTLVIAHRLSTIVSADQIIVLGAGGVVEVGTHSELLKQDGAYSKLWLEQFLHE